MSAINTARLASDARLMKRSLDTTAKMKWLI